MIILNTISIFGPVISTREVLHLFFLLPSCFVLLVFILNINAQISIIQLMLGIIVCRLP